MANKLRFLLIIFLLLPDLARAATLNKNVIIPQSEVTYNGITAASINDFLKANNSQLADYMIPASFDVYFPIGKGQWDKISVPQQWQSNNELEVYSGKTFAQLVYEWSTTNRANRSPDIPSPGQINPLIPLATIDKESASITSTYRTSIVSDHPITMSWLMGYGFNGKMDNCVKYGDCDIDYNRQRAQWYGGPGQQVVEGVSSLKYWSTNPTPLNSCNGQWQNMQVQGECLNLENSISLALYRYTPNFSGNQLFLDLYTTIKNTFTLPPPSPTPPNATPPPPDEKANEINTYELESYAGSVTLVGTKAPNNRAYFGDKLIADINTTNWQLTFEPSIGNKQYSLDYKRADGSLINSKSIMINRHKVGDINGDGKVDILDLSVLGNFWGHTDPTNPLANLNPTADNEVNILDLSIMANNFEK